MKHKTIVLIILGFLILASLCLCENHFTEGLNNSRHNTHILHRGQYVADTGYLSSEDDSYRLGLRRGSLRCWVKKKNGRWGHNWNMNANGSKIMLLNSNGTLQFKSSKNDEYIPITESHGANSLVLTAYGTLELKSETGGNGETLWTYPVAEGFAASDNDADDTKLQNLMTNLETDRSELTKHAVKKIDAYIKKGNTSGTHAVLNSSITMGKWIAFRKKVYDDESVPSGFEQSTETANYSVMPGEHDTVLENARKLDRLRNTLDNKVKVLNSLGDSHITDEQMHMNSTIFITLAWTALASSLVYYTFTN